ncbi:MAG: NAD-dependent epimerase/dehydratase family protein [Candidatus Saccharimonadales bacterium]
MTDPKTILVTGCAGFIGGNFVNQFKGRFPGTKIIGIDNFSTGRTGVIKSEVTLYKGSVLDEALVKRVFTEQAPEYVFHFAALPNVSHANEHPRLTTEVNVVGTVALLEASKEAGVKRFIYSSSSSIYGGANKLPTKESENPPNPKSPYAIQKYTGEPFCKSFSDLFGLDTVSLRYFNAFGPGQYGNSAYSSVIPAWLESLYSPSDKRAFMEGDGSQTRDFCYVDNIVSANILAMEAPGPLKGDVFNIAHGGRTSLEEVRTLIEKYTARKLDLEKRPSRLGDIKHSYADISKANQILDYSPIVSFEDGLKRTIEWFESKTK